MRKTHHPLPRTWRARFAAALAVLASAAALFTFGQADPCTASLLDCWTQDCPGLRCIPVESIGGGTACVTRWEQNTPWCCMCTLTVYLCREDWEGPECGMRYERIFTSAKNRTCALASGVCVQPGG